MSIHRNGILLCVIILSAFGLVTLWSFGFGGDDYLFLKQIVWITLGIVMATALSDLNLVSLKQSRILLGIYFIFILLLLVLLFFQDPISGAKSWYTLGGFSFQPAEFVKIILILILAKYLSRRHIATRDWKHIFVLGFYLLLPFILILLQPDFGSAIVLLGIWVTLILMTGISRNQFLIFTLISGTIAFTMWFFVLQDYQKDRVASFFSPLADIYGVGYNAHQSLIAIGSGQLLGKGLGEGSQSRLHFLPESETDFIFAAFAEEWGFVGAIILLVLFTILISLIVSLSFWQNGNFESLFLLGAAAYFFIHILVNIGMNTNLLPVTGIPLPFMSYGGSHILAEFITIGIILNFANQKNIRPEK